MNPLRRLFVQTTALGYQALKPAIFSTDAQPAHARFVKWLERADAVAALRNGAGVLHDLATPQASVRVGDLTLQHRMILAAGLVKGHGYVSEDAALQAVANGVNIMPGWRTMPQLAGLVEFGSFTRHPRPGNDGTVMWRDDATRSTQNRVGLKNPGAIAAATFLQHHIIDLPYQFGINIAPSPGTQAEQQDIQDVVDCIEAFLERDVVPNWFTLNLSCPNTEDDPTGNQTEQKTRALCQAVIAQIASNNYRVPLWVKVSPDLAEAQYQILMRVFAEVGVQAVVATNTLAKPAPHDPTLTAGVGGTRLHPHALRTATVLKREQGIHQYPVAIIGCGGIMDGQSYLAYKARGIDVVQYYSALIFRSPLAAAIIESEAQ